MKYNNFWSAFLILLQLQNKFCKKRAQNKSGGFQSKQYKLERFCKETIQWDSWSRKFEFWFAFTKFCFRKKFLKERYVLHKVLTYIEYRAVFGVFRTIDPPTPPCLPLASVSSPRTKGGGYTLAERWGGGGSIFWKTPDIGLATYSIIPLRDTCTRTIGWSVRRTKPSLDCPFNGGPILFLPA